MNVLQRLRGLAARYAYAAALVARTMTIGVVTRRGRLLIARLAREAHYRDGPAPRLPRVAVDAITDGATTVVLPFPATVDGNVSLLELLVIARLARERAPATVFEIGTFDGRTTATLAANTPAASRVFTLDLPAGQQTRFELVSWERAYVDKPTSGERFRHTPHAARIEQLYGDSAVFDFSPYPSDFVFIDGSHAYPYVRNDSERAMTMLRNGRGVLLWHDYGEWEGVTRALDELQETDPRFAAIRHVEGTTLAILEVR
jgi:predicted O-methyltransferase YrrM